MDKNSILRCDLVQQGNLNLTLYDTTTGTPLSVPGIENMEFEVYKLVGSWDDYNQAPGIGEKVGEFTGNTFSSDLTIASVVGNIFTVIAKDKHRNNIVTTNAYRIVPPLPNTPRHYQFPCNGKHLNSYTEIIDLMHPNHNRVVFGSTATIGGQEYQPYTKYELGIFQGADTKTTNGFQYLTCFDDEEIRDFQLVDFKSVSLSHQNRNVIEIAISKIEYTVSETDNNFRAFGMAGVVNPFPMCGVVSDDVQHTKPNIVVLKIYDQHNMPVYMGISVKVKYEGPLTKYLDVQNRHDSYVVQLPQGYDMFERFVIEIGRDDSSFVDECTEFKVHPHTQCFTITYNS